MVSFWLQLAVVIACLCVGARINGIGIGLAGGLGLTILTFVFHLRPSSPPIDVMLIIAAVVTMASTLQAAGGLDYLVQVAERILRKNPNHITLVGPMVTCIFTLFAGTAFVALSVFPVIAEVAYEAKVRPERPLSISVVAASQAITGSPMSAATAALLGMLTVHGVTLGQIMLVCIPSVLLACLIGALVVYRKGAELEDDPEYQRRLAAGEIQPAATHSNRELLPRAKLSVALFSAVIFLVVIFGTFKSLLPSWQVAGKAVTLSIPHTIEMIMLGAAAIIVMTCRVNPAKIISSSVFQSGMMGVMAIFGVAWMTDTFFIAHQQLFITTFSDIARNHIWLFAVILFFMSAMLFSQGATVRSLMPLGLTLGITAPHLVAMFPAVNGTFFFPATGTIVGAVAFDRSGTTKIGKYVLNHSFMLPGVISTFAAVGIGFVLAMFVF